MSSQRGRAESERGELVEVQQHRAPAKAATKEPTERTDDPVRMYLREMGTVDLLSREGEIAIAKRIEAGREAMIGQEGHKKRRVIVGALSVSSLSGNIAKVQGVGLTNPHTPSVDDEDHVSAPDSQH